MAKDSLSIRMKSFYEERSRTYLPRRTYTIIRLDGRSFKNYTKGLVKPFDDGLINDMDETAKYLCKNIQGAKLAFVQSDEITLVLTDFENITTDAWFDGEVQKMTSISASMATEKFNQLRLIRQFNDFSSEYLNYDSSKVVDILSKFKMGQFDSRAFVIPSKEEVMNNLQWRQQDTVRNSISTVAQTLYSPSELNGKNQSDMQEMCFQKGINWNDYLPKYKRGRLIVKQEIEVNGAMRNKWVSTDPEIFSQNKEQLIQLL